MPKRTLWVDLPEKAPDGSDAYPGFKLRVWVNFPSRLAEDLKAGSTPEATAAALRRIVLEHNGWCDDEGNPFPPADAPDFYESLPQELGLLIALAINEAMARFPNSLVPRRPISGAT
jgi:hypothetical protein